MAFLQISGKSVNSPAEKLHLEWKDHKNIHKDILFGKYQKIFQIGMSPVAFWKLFHETGVMKQNNKVQGWKKLRHYFTIVFLFNAAREKVDDQVLIW